MPELILTGRAVQDLKDLPETVRAAVSSVIERLRLPSTAGQPLLGPLRPQWSARVGNYRIIYTIEGSPVRKRVVVRAIRHRAVAYGRRRRRRP